MKQYTIQQKITYYQKRIHDCSLKESQRKKAAVMVRKFSNKESDPLLDVLSIVSKSSKDHKSYIAKYGEERFKQHQLEANGIKCWIDGKCTDIHTHYTYFDGKRIDLTIDEAIAFKEDFPNSRINKTGTTPDFTKMTIKENVDFIDKEKKLYSLFKKGKQVGSTKKKTNGLKVNGNNNFINIDGKKKFYKT